VASTYIFHGSCCINVRVTRENALDCIVGVTSALYDEVETIALGEKMVREAIDKGIAETVTSCDWPECSTTAYENGPRTSM
jgi:hypothetical protein